MLRAALFRLTVPVDTSWPYPVPAVVPLRATAKVLPGLKVTLPTVRTPGVAVVPGFRVPLTMMPAEDGSNASCEGEVPEVPVPMSGNWLLVEGVWLNDPAVLYWFVEPARSGG